MKVGVGVFVGVTVGSRVGTVVGATVAVGITEGVIEIVGVPVIVGTDVGPFAAIALFLGRDVVNNTKSEALLSVSKPLPNVISVPPVNNDCAVELAEAFLTKLPFASGLSANGEPSVSAAVPKPTLSTIVIPASL